MDQGGVLYLKNNFNLDFGTQTTLGIQTKLSIYNFHLHNYHCFSRYVEKVDFIS